MEAGPEDMEEVGVRLGASLSKHGEEDTREASDQRHPLSRISQPRRQETRQEGGKAESEGGTLAGWDTFVLKAQLFWEVDLIASCREVPAGNSLGL